MTAQARLGLVFLAVGEVLYLVLLVQALLQRDWWRAGAMAAMLVVGAVLYRLGWWRR